MSGKRLVSAIVGAICAAAFIAPVAQAQNPDDTFGVVSCLLASLTGNSAVNSIEKDLSIPGGPFDGPLLWLLDVDGGNFTFGGTATCGAVDVASRNVYTANGGWAVGAGNAFTVTAAGTFNNLICATTTFNGTANVKGQSNVLALGNTGSTGATDIDFQFGVTFAAGVGTASFVVDPGADGSGSNKVGPNVVTGGNGAGAIDIIPTSGSCTNGEGVTAFTVNGAFATSISGNEGYGN